MKVGSSDFKVLVKVCTITYMSLQSNIVLGMNKEIQSDLIIIVPLQIGLSDAWKWCFWC